jgi:plastocyanin
MVRVARGLFGFGLVVALAACGGSSGGGATTAASAGGASPAAAACTKAASMGAVQVTIENFKFSPEPIKAKVGDTISWTNKDSTPHSAALDDGSCATDTLSKDAEGNLTFSAPGTYPYHCAIHPTQMKGTIEVSG